MDNILDLPDEQLVQYEYAGFWIRFIAIIIDAILLALIRWPVAFILGDAMGYHYNTSFVHVNINLAGTVSFAIGIAYFVLMETSEKQATIGKMVFGLKVIDQDGKRLNASKALIRYLSKFVSAIILLIGFIMAGFDSKKQALHDKIAGTFVVYK